MIEHVCIEVPNCQGDDWIKLTFSSNFTIASEHEPILLEHGIKYPMVEKFEQYTKVAISKLRAICHAHRCEYQLVLAPFGHDLRQPEQPEPNMQAYNLALLLADLYFSKHIELPEHSALEAGFCFNQGLVTIAPTQVAPSNKQIEDDKDVRSSIVHRLDNASQISHYQARFSEQVLSQIKAFIPKERYESCVYFPLIDNASGNAEQLSSFKVLYIPSEHSQLSIFGQTTIFPNEVRKFINQHADLKLMINGLVFIECEKRPAKKHLSWQLALVTALQMALGLMPRVDKPVICTGQVSPLDNTENNEIDLLQSLQQARKVNRVGDTDKKYNLIEKLSENSATKYELMTSLNRPVQDHSLPWLFYLPEVNYMADKALYTSSQILVSPVNFWHVEDLLSF